MVFIILIAIGALILFGPNLWVSHVLKKYNRKPESNFPGTGGELARHLLDRFDLHDVNVVVTEAGDHYNPHDRSVALTQDKYDGKTLAAIVIAAHECGHAIISLDPECSLRSTFPHRWLSGHSFKQATCNTTIHPHYTKCVIVSYHFARTLLYLLKNAHNSAYSNRVSSFPSSMARS